MRTSNCQDLKILSLEDDFAEYSRLFEKVRTQSVYLLPSYLKSTRYGEKYPVKIMVLEENGGIALLPLVRRCINDLPFFTGLSTQLWDFVSPYEYSSVATNADNDQEHNRLTGQLLDRVAAFCAKENIVSEFIRFDPFLTGLATITSRYAVKKSCDNIYIDLREEMPTILKNFHSSVRKNLRMASSAGLRFVSAEKSTANIDEFINLYQASMQRLGAKDYYFFSPEYFHMLLTGCEGTSLFFVCDPDNRTVAASILLHHGTVAHHHLTGYDTKAMHLRPNDFMIYSLIHWGQAHNLHHLHLGGGASSICNFKGKFSPARIPYYIGSRVHNQELYQHLCSIRQQERDFQPGSGYFPLYRAGS